MPQCHIFLLIIVFISLKKEQAGETGSLRHQHARVMAVSRPWEGGEGTRPARSSTQRSPPPAASLQRQSEDPWQSIAQRRRQA